MAGGGALTGAWTAGASNAWNPVGWVVLGVAAVATIGYVGYKVYKSAKSKSKAKSVPKAKSKSKPKRKKGISARPELKRQGRENIEKKKGDNWKSNSGKKPRPQPRSHHPSKKGHRKY